MKKENRKESGGEVASNEFSGRVESYSIGDGLQFSMSGKKGRSRTCMVAAGHQMLAVMADTISHAHWAERKITVSGKPGDNGVLMVTSIQVGEPAKSKQAAAAASDQPVIVAVKS